MFRQGLIAVIAAALIAIMVYQNYHPKKETKINPIEITSFEKAKAKAYQTHTFGEKSPKVIDHKIIKDEEIDLNSLLNPPKIVDTNSPLEFKNEIGKNDLLLFNKKEAYASTLNTEELDKISVIFLYEFINNLNSNFGELNRLCGLTKIEVKCNLMALKKFLWRHIKSQIYQDKNTNLVYFQAYIKNFKALLALFDNH